MEKCRIVVADDEPIERKVLCKNIQSYFEDEVEIFQAANGIEAVEAFSKERCQVALLDITMPGMNGLDAAEVIRGKDKNCSIIFLTAYDEFEYAQRAIRVQALDYLLKPGTREELIAVLEEAIRLSRQSGTAALAGEGQERNSASGEMLTAGKPEDEREKQPGHGWEERPDSLKIRAMKKQIYEFLEERYMEDLSLQDAASRLNYSEPYFCKFFKQQFDVNFITYLTQLRVEKAKRLLADVAVNVRDVGQQVGFHDSSYFAKVFRRITGVSPSEYRLAILEREFEEEGTKY